MSPDLIYFRHNFQTSAISRDIHRAAKFTVAGAVTVGVAGSGARTGEFGSLIIGYVRNQSLKQQLFYAILGFALWEAMRLFYLLVASTSSSPWEGPFRPPTGLSPVSHVPCMFLFLYLPRQPGESSWLRVCQRKDK